MVIGIFTWLGALSEAIVDYEEPEQCTSSKLFLNFIKPLDQSAAYILGQLQKKNSVLGLAKMRFLAKMLGQQIGLMPLILLGFTSVSP